MQVNLGNSIISTLGNPSSLIPMAVKDTVNSAGISYFSYDAGGKVEARDRILDEFGTMAIWLLGIPFFKKISDWTFYKAAKLNPSVDVRVVDSKDHTNFAQKILKNADEKGKNVLESINKAKDNLPKFKGLFYTKFILSTLLTFASYIALTKYKQKSTEKAIKAEFLKKRANEQFMTAKSWDAQVFNDFNQVAFKGKPNMGKNPAFAGKEKSNKNVSFKGNFVERFMFDPVQNLMLVDAGITSERLLKSRNKYEFTEYAIKEGSLLFVMYILGDIIKRGLEKTSEKFANLPIDMDLRFINSEDMKNAMKSPEKILEEVQKVKNLKTEKEVLNYIADNQNSIIVKGAKISDLIGSMKHNSDMIDPSQYIKTDDIKGLAESLKKFVNVMKEQHGGNVEVFLKKARNNKIGATVMSIVSCCALLGYAMPKVLFKYREKSSGTTDFHVAEEVKRKLEAEEAAKKNMV